MKKDPIPINTAVAQGTSSRSATPGQVEDGARRHDGAQARQQQPSWLDHIAVA